jgi:hypothetical protein
MPSVHWASPRDVTPTTRPFESSAGPPESPEQTGLSAIHSPCVTIGVPQAVPAQNTFASLTPMR